ncbi:hypothetical protein H4R33_000520, partial [Dimargaris cristalligena]
MSGYKVERDFVGSTEPRPAPGLTSPAGLIAKNQPLTIHCPHCRTIVVSNMTHKGGRKAGIMTV